MSSRVTRSSAKLSADISLSNNQSVSETQQSNTQPPDTKSTGKRKLSAGDTNQEAPTETSEPSFARRSKRQKKVQAETPSSTVSGPQSLASTAAPRARRQSKGKAIASMSTTNTSPETPADLPTSPPATSSSSKRRSGKGKSSAKEQADTSAGSSRKRTRSSTKKAGDNTAKGNTASSAAEAKPEKTVPPSGDAEATGPEESSGDNEEGRDYGDGDDDGMDEDPFESSFLGRYGGHGGMSSTLRALSGIMSGMTSRFRQILDQLRQKGDPSVHLIALQELSEILLVSTEDNLAGHFSPDSYVKELVVLMQPGEFGEENPEIMLLACRCLANMMEALPASTASVVYGGAVPVLLSKLLEIQYMDLAEQALITLEKISLEFPSFIVRDGGLTACLTYLDFFATSTQRNAVTTAANCCRNIPSDSFPVVKDVMPILLNVLNSNDQRVVEQGCLCVSRIVESFKSQDSKLEEMMSSDLLRAILRLLLPGSTNMIGPNIHTQFLKVLSITARASASLSVELFKMNVVDTLFQFLTGVSPPSGVDNTAQKIDSVMIMQALIHRPRDQIYETLNVVCELLPGLDQEDIVFLAELRDLGGIPSDTALSKAKATSIRQRLHLLADCKDELRRFAVVLLPTLTDAYSSTVNFSVRQKVLTAQLKMLSHLDIDILEDALRYVPYASFLAAILSQQDHPFLVAAALQASDLLLKRLKSIYEYQFYREGVITEVRKLADRPVKASPSLVKKEPVVGAPVTAEPTAAPPAVLDERHSDDDDDDHNEDDNDDGPESDPDDDEAAAAREELDNDHDDDSSVSSGTPPPQIAMPPNSDIQDVITRLAKKFIEQYENEASRSLRQKASQILDDLRMLVSNIGDCYETGREQEGARLFKQLANSFEGDALESITSYELLTAKVVNALLEVFETTQGQPNELARSAFVEAFMTPTLTRSMRTTTADSEVTPFSMLVAKLQDLLSRAEHFEVLTVHSNSYDSNRSSAASMLAKQIRVKLSAADDSGIPRGYRNIMISIHAIANFKALDDYLRPRIIVAQSSRSRHSHVPAGSSAASQLAGVASASGTESPTGRRPAGIPPVPVPGTSSGSRSSSRKSAKPKTPATPATTEEACTSAKNRSQSSRRSSRKTRSQAEQPSTPPSEPPQERSDLEGALECPDEAPLSDDDDDDNDDITGALETIVGEMEEEVDDDEADPTAVNMEVAPTGKVTARQEDGTRIATPTQSSEPARAAPPTRSSEMARSLLSSLSGRAMSYAAALQSAPQDWHLEFSVNGQTISNDTTIYRAVHFHQNQGDEAAARNIWSALHSINYKRVAGPSVPEPDTLSPPPEAITVTSSGLPHSLEQNPTTAAILRLLQILHELNANLDEVLPEDCTTRQIKREPLAQFVNTKLTAKLNRQLEEPLIVASNCLPSWSEDLARLYPFLFPFETRHLFLQSTSFGYSRSMTRWQNTQTANDSRRDRRRDERPYLGRLQRQKVRISRNKILESAVKVMELYGASPSIIEVEYFEEVGTGLGPTLEFYSTVSKEFSKKKLRLWRENDTARGEEFAFGRRGLFPAPMGEEQASTDNGQKILMLFKMLGKFVARSMLDSRMIDISFNPTFFRVNSSTNAIKPSLAAVRAVDQDLARSLQMLKQFSAAKRRIDEQRISPVQKAQKTAMIQIGGATVEDLSLDFTLAGYPHIELIPNGANIPVTIHNVGTYIDQVIAYTVGQGVQKQVEAFRTGFSQVFPYSALSAFTPDELVSLFGHADEDWSIETLTDSIKADHGYNLDSKTVRNLLQVMSDFAETERRDFLQFVTGSPKLPIGGFKSLTPMFTVVCKPSEPPYTSDDYLPSVMTCVNYLKMPDYSSLEVLKAKVQLATREGQGAFHLS